MASIANLMGMTGSVTAAPATAGVASSTAPIATEGTLPDKYAQARLLYPEYFDPQTGLPLGGLNTTASKAKGVTVSHTRTKPETHPWLYPQTGADPLVGQNYDKATYMKGGVAQGFPQPQLMTMAEQQAAADQVLAQAAYRSR